MHKNKRNKDLSLAYDRSGTASGNVSLTTIFSLSLIQSLSNQPLNAAGEPGRSSTHFELDSSGTLVLHTRLIARRQTGGS